jgi:hypothetical protein
LSPGFTFTFAQGLGALVAAAAVYVSYLGYKRSKASDLLAAQAGVAVSQTVTTGQVLESLDRLIQRLNEDNAVLRTELVKANDKLDVQLLLIGELRAELTAARKNGINGITGAPLNPK